MGENDLNKKLIGFNGVIGRLDFFYNIVLCLIITSLFNLPFIIYMLFDFKFLANASVYGFSLVSLPFYIRALYLLGVSLNLFIIISNVFRRLNDINGRVNNIINFSCALFLIFVSFGFLYCPQSLLFNLSILYDVFFIFLLCLEGKVTSKFPYNFKHEFNWGAFFGTWIWGLFNKAYLSLLHIILFFTPFSFLFRLICGIKGNEWANKNTKPDDIDKYKKSQNKQGIIFGVLYFISMPFILIFVALSVGVGIVVFDSVQKANNPKQITIIEKLSKNYFDALKSNFDYYEIGDSENAFYILPDVWERLEKNQRMVIFSYAVRIANYEKMKKNGSDKNASRENKEKIKDYIETKIYSSKNKELLGEYVLNMDLSKDNIDFKEFFKSSMNAYRFYEPK